MLVCAYMFATFASVGDGVRISTDLSRLPQPEVTIYCCRGLHFYDFLGVGVGIEVH